MRVRKITILDLSEKCSNIAAYYLVYGCIQVWLVKNPISLNVDFHAIDFLGTAVRMEG